MEEKIIKAYIKKNIKEKCVLSVLNINEKPSIQEGENFTSSMLRYRVEILHESGEKSIKNVIIKKLQAAKLQVKVMLEHSFFTTEIHVYSKVLKLMRKLMDEFEDKRDKLWCEMIAYTPFEMLLLEDLRDLNFKTMNKGENLGYDHTTLAMKCLGRFHAMNRILLKRTLINGSEFPSFFFARKQMISIFYVSSLKLLEEVVIRNWGEKWSHFAARLRKLQREVPTIMSGLSKIDESRFNVMNHGDCWTNNMLFKHVEGTDIPCAVKFIDFQLAHYNSYAWDVTYFLYNATCPEIRRTRYLELITAYHQSLTSNLMYFNYTDNDAPTMDNLIEEMNRLKLYGLILLCSTFAINKSSVSNAFDFNKCLNNPNDPCVGINKSVFLDKNYKESIQLDLENFIKQGLL